MGFKKIRKKVLDFSNTFFVLSMVLLIGTFGA